MAKSEVVRCKVDKTVTGGVNIEFWFPLDNPTKAIFMVDRSVTPAVKADLREHPPFYHILPCPYCGVEEDRNHKPLDHVDPRLGPIHNYIEDEDEPTDER
jgi:hypothetical protein